MSYINIGQQEVIKTLDCAVLIIARSRSSEIYPLVESVINLVLNRHIQSKN